MITNSTTLTQSAHRVSRGQRTSAAAIASARKEREDHEPNQEKLDKAVDEAWFVAAAGVFLLDSGPYLHEKDHRTHQAYGGQDGDHVPQPAAPRTGLRLCCAHGPGHYLIARGRRSQPISGGD